MSSVDKEDLHDIIERHEIDIRALKGAFDKDESGDPDYVGHRMFHRSRVESNIDGRKRRTEILANVGSWAVIGVISILISQYLPKILEVLAK